MSLALKGISQTDISLGSCQKFRRCKSNCSTGPDDFSRSKEQIYCKSTSLEYRLNQLARNMLKTDRHQPKDKAMNIKKFLSTSVLTIGLIAVGPANAITQFDGSLELPAPFNRDTVTLKNESSDPDAPEIFAADIEVNINDLGDTGVVFEFNFTDSDVFDPGVIVNSDSSLNSFEDNQAGTDTLSSLQSGLNDASLAYADLLSNSGNLTADPSNLFIAVLTSDLDESFATAYGFAGDQDESRWVVGPLDSGTYNLNVVSLLEAIGSGQVTISAVPIPAAAILFGTALAGFAGFSARRKA